MQNRQWPHNRSFVLRFCATFFISASIKLQVVACLDGSREIFTILLNPADTAADVPPSEESSINNADADPPKSLTLLSNGEKAVLTRKWSEMKEINYL
jgi:hypothetical protein